MTTIIRNRASSCDSTIRFRTFIIFAILAPATAHADAGIPLIALTIPAMLVLIVPVVLIEALVYKRLLRRKLSKCVVPVLLANLASTLIGIPLVCIFRICALLVGALFVHALQVDSLFQTQFGTFLTRLFSGIVILRPGEALSTPGFFIIFGAELTIAYLVSVWYELRTIRKLLKADDPEVLKKAAWISNAFSYAFLVLFIASLVFLKGAFRKSLEKESWRYLEAFQEEPTGWFSNGSHLVLTFSQFSNIDHRSGKHSEPSIPSEKPAKKSETNENHLRTMGCYKQVARYLSVPKSRFPST
jgi:hypothetical protein